MVQESHEVSPFISQSDIHPEDCTKEELVNLLPYLSTEDWYRFGAVLYHLKRRCKGGEFRVFCETSRFKTRTITNMVAIYKRLSDLHIPPPTDISWRYLAEAIYAINQWNCEEIFDFLRHCNNREEIQEAVREDRFFNIKPEKI